VSHKQITRAERYLIQEHLRQGHNASEIARMLKRHRSTISREIRRNLHDHRGYYEWIAQWHANGRRRRTRKGSRFSPGEWSLVTFFLRLDWSPEQIALTLRWDRVLTISHETIYRYIWQDHKSGGDLYRHLRQSRKRRRKRYRRPDSRGVLRGKRSITERPAEAEKRLRRGHVEIDLMHGRSKDCVLTMVDRKSRYVEIRKLKDKTMTEVNRALIALIRRHGVRTVTADNGSEFHDYKHIEKLTGAVFYFAAPYHSWERGTCENANGLIRQYLPKSHSMADVTQQTCNAIAWRLNSRPRKVLNLRRPCDVHTD
jgi:transposase, IS30 family